MSLDATLIPLVSDVAVRYQLDLPLLLSQIGVESGGNSWAWNPEPGYRWVWDVRKNRPFRAVTPIEAESAKPPNDFPSITGDADQEWWGQRASWGLLQIVGGTARELGFNGPYLTKLADPETGLNFGAKYLRKCLNLSHDDYRVALARYNGVGPAAEAYAEKVMALAGRP